ncbi:translocation and assembly module TamA [Neisseria sp. HSC-16F19]|nr:autotransporter assembly complex family protein [Neisseria sp. HSC-16F19]MCP2040304.1 translocation and assembly module TamA [Neisseria sp. HSC-16F19]
MKTPRPLLLFSALALLAALPARAQDAVVANVADPTPAPLPADTDSSIDEADKKPFSLFNKPAARAIRYPVEIQADNKDIQNLVQEYLPLITQQQDTEAELDRDQVEFLAEEAPAHTRTMLETQGYFNGKVDMREQGEGWRIDIATGPRTHIDSVSVAILGDILGDDDLPQYYKNAMENWSLPVGEPFTQTEWSNSKTSVLSSVVRKKYPLAAVTASKATINPDNNTAQLSLQIDSKQPIYFGDLTILGTQRYPESVARGIARFRPGMPYDLDLVLDYQQALEQDSHYGGAAVEPLWTQIKEDRVPVQATVTEMKRQKFDLALRYDSAEGPGIRTGYEHYNVFNRGYVGSLLLDTDRYKTTAGIGLKQPRSSNGYYWTGSLNHSRSTVQQVTKNNVTGGVWYVRDRDNIDSRLGLEYITESARITNGPDLGRSNALMLTAAWKRQNIQTLLRPANGYYLEGKIGTTIGSLASSSSIQRVETRAGYYYTPEEKKYGTWVLRGQLGYVRTGSDSRVPSSLLFRSGGATSVRGYEYESIGIQGPNNAVLPDRVVAVGSVEYQVPVHKNFSVAAFHDAGAVSNSFANMKWQHGSGIGLRWFSPLAPFSFDLAYGHSDKKVRWHISLGTRF